MADEIKVVHTTLLKGGGGSLGMFMHRMHATMVSIHNTKDSKS